MHLLVLQEKKREEKLVLLCSAILPCHKPQYKSSYKSHDIGSFNHCNLRHPYAFHFNVFTISTRKSYFRSRTQVAFPFFNMRTGTCKIISFIIDEYNSCCEWNHLKGQLFQHNCVAPCEHFSHLFYVYVCMYVVLYVDSIYFILTFRVAL